MEGNKKRKVKSKVGYVVGSIALFAAACVAIPVALTIATGALYKVTAPEFKDDDDWGPVIEKKEKVDE